MRQTIYVDVLLAVNFFINYFLMLSAGKIMRTDISRTRICLASVFGSLSALSIFLPEMGTIAESLFKLAISAVMVLIAYKWKSWRIFVRYLLVTCAVTFGFGGTMFALWLVVAPDGMYYRNGITYFNISPEFIIVVTILCYTVITVAGRMCGSSEQRAPRYKVTVCNNGNTVLLNVMGDTGNLLSEPFSGYPVMITKRTAVQKVMPKNFEHYTDKNADLTALPNCRIIPYSSVGGTGLLTAFLPEKIRVINDERKLEINNCYIAVSDNINAEEYDGIINPDIFMQ